ncbi:CPBP family intramembrane glutamic endopeptidase [Halegenticoccus soli]|uniref:CPBP family intramembrane glutamic endopeptidase n=1 Tax=Halegenticoccus soli TaxID=1985678 RepID=UPI000C6D78A1|nr:CPBP family intramembrane glutamic endopeptidase [Halegenticoccus soli]
MPLDPASLVWNRDERRLRALWRILAAIVLLAASFVGFGLLVAPSLGAVRVALVGFLGTAVADVAIVTVAQAAVGTLFVLVVLLAGLLLDRRRLSDFGFRFDRDWWVDFGFGLALGAALMTLVFAAELALGWVRVTGTLRAASGAFLPGFVSALALFLFVGVYEELFARGYLLTNVAEGLDGFGPIGRRGAVAVALLLSSAVFGVLHANNPNATALSTFNISLAGVFLALGYVLTGELSIPIGLHITWNFFQGAVYGFPVSGLAPFATVVAVEQRGPDLVTGGEFGPEAGFIGAAAIALGSLAIVGWVRWRYGAVRIDPEVTVPDLRRRG